MTTKSITSIVFRFDEEERKNGNESDGFDSRDNNADKNDKVRKQR